MLSEDFIRGGRVLTVNNLGGNRVLVILCEKDMEDFSLDFDKLSLDDSHSRKVLLRIMNVACRKSGIEMKGRSVKIEALTLDGECYFLLKVKKKSRHTYRIKKSADCVCYLLGESGNFLDTMEKLYRQNVYCNRNSAYVYDNKYYLIFDYPSIPKKLKIILSEYGQKSGGKLTTAKIKENGKLICRHNAILQIGKFLV